MWRGEKGSLEISQGPLMVQKGGNRHKRPSPRDASGAATPSCRKRVLIPLLTRRALCIRDERADQGA